MTGISIGPGRAASFGPDRTSPLSPQLLAELLRLAAELIQLADEDIHAREVWPFHPEMDCKLRSFRQSAPVRHVGRVQTDPQFNRTSGDAPGGCHPR